jgi:hypothetical protein
MHETCQSEQEFNFAWRPSAERNADCCDTIVTLRKSFFQAFYAKSDFGVGLR